MLNFILALRKNIPSIQIYVGEVEELVQLRPSTLATSPSFISKEHPAFTHYPGQKDDRDWIYPTVTGYHPSFFAYWKKCSKQLYAPELFSRD